MVQRHLTRPNQPFGLSTGASAPGDRGLRGTPAIDRSVLGEWLAGDDGAIDELLAVFRDSIHAEHARMREALDRGDLGEYAAAAHRLRGAALSMGAHALAEVAGTLNAAALAKDGASCVGGFSVLETHLCLVTAELPAADPALGRSASR